MHSYLSFWVESVFHWFHSLPQSQTCSCPRSTPTNLHIYTKKRRTGLFLWASHAIPAFIVLKQINTVGFSLATEKLMMRIHRICNDATQLLLERWNDNHFEHAPGPKTSTNESECQRRNNKQSVLTCTMTWTLSFHAITKNLNVCRGHSSME